jgi:hypothetical protein
VNLAAHRIDVRHNTVSVDGGVQEQTTKSRSERRTLPLSDTAVAALLTWQLRQAEEREGQEAWGTCSQWRTADRLSRVHHPAVPRDSEAG